MPPNGSVIILTGSPQSGKTTAATILEEFGYKRIYAGGVIAALDGEPPLVGRRAIVERAERMLREQGPKWFAQRLIMEAQGHQKVVFDGIRPIRTIQYILEHTPKAKLFFIQASEEMRRARYASSAADVSYDELIASGPEKTADGIETLAIAIRNEGDVAKFRKALLAAIAE